MRPFITTIYGTTASPSGPTTSPVYPADRYTAPTNITVSVVVTGTINYTVQYTFDDVYATGYSPSTGNWTNHPSLTAQTTTKDSNISYPVQGIRIIANSGTGTALFTIIQSGGGVS
jgi:hypothetical protein